jgi:hypothetical protein
VRNKTAEKKVECGGKLGVALIAYQEQPFSGPASTKLQLRDLLNPVKPPIPNHTAQDASSPARIEEGEY